MSTKIFVRERRKIEKGEKKPRFRVVGVSGGERSSALAVRFRRAPSHGTTMPLTSWFAQPIMRVRGEGHAAW